MTDETLHEAKAPVEGHVRRVRDRLRQGYRMTLEAPDGLASEIIGRPETLQAIADRLDARALGPALDRVLEAVEAMPKERINRAMEPVGPRGPMGYRDVVLTLLHALRAEQHSASGARGGGERGGGS